MNNEHARREQAYREREKELDGLYQLAELFSRSAGDTHTVLNETATIMRASMQFAEITSVSVSADELTEVAGPPVGSHGPTTADSYRAVHAYDEGRQVVIEVAYLAPNSATGASPALDESERRLIEAATQLLGNVLIRMDATAALREKNIALREILHQIEGDKQELLRAVSTGIETLIMPYVQELSRSTDLAHSDRRTVSILETALHQLMNQDAALSMPAMRELTPREAQVAGLIRNGLSTKEIAEFLHIALPTVQRHRNTIRRKLGLRRSASNLTTFLRFNG